MARSKSKQNTMQVRRINKKSERKATGVFTRLKTDEWMKGYALFSPDPEADKNPGWFEYLEHYDNSNNQYVPCTGDDCYMCELGDSPSTRALTLWYFPDNPAKEKFKAFKMNGYLIRDFIEIEEEEGGVFGKRFRVKRLSDKGEYRVSPQSDKPLTKAEIKKLLKEAAEQGIDFPASVLKQARVAISKIEAAGALTEDDDDDEDDDEDEEPEEKKSRKGKEKKSSKKSQEDENEDEEDDEDEEEEEDDEDEDEDENDDEDEDDDEDDEDEDDEDEEDEDEDEEEDDEDSLSGEKLVVVSASEKDEIITVKMDGKNTKLYVGQGLEPEWDTVKKGAEITVDAEKDDEGDWVLTAVKVKKAKGKGKSKK